MKKMFQTMMMYALAGAMLSGDNPVWEEEQRSLTPEQRQALRDARERAEKERLEKRGVKQWNIDGVIVWAINRKNAERKVKKLLANATHL